MEFKIFKKPKNVAEQYLYLKTKYECLPGSGIFNNTLIWEQEIKSCEFSKKYIIRVEYDMSIPKVYLNNQSILKSKNETIPHNYYTKYISEEKQTVQLCLFYPKRKEWQKYMYIADTIVPWTAEWIYYYEIWRITGEWYGGGIHNV